MNTVLNTDSSSFTHENAFQLILKNTKQSSTHYAIAYNMECTLKIIIILKTMNI